MKNLTTIIFALLFFTSASSMSEAIHLKCTGEAEYNQEPLGVGSGLDVYINKSPNADTSYKIFGSDWITLTTTKALYSHYTSRADVENKVKELFKLDRTTLEISWIRTGLDSNAEEYVVLLRGGVLSIPTRAEDII